LKSRRRRLRVQVELDHELFEKITYEAGQLDMIFDDVLNKRLSERIPADALMPRLWPQSWAMKRLGPQIFRDAQLAGWIKPRAEKKGVATRRAKVLYARSDIEAVEERMLNGEYPEPPAK
jgi:hypothetical protein